LAIGLGFVLLGFLLLPREGARAIAPIAFFGACTLVFAATIVRKWRFSRLRPLRAEIAGGVRIPPSRSKALVLGAAITVLGVILVVFGRDHGVILWLISWFIAVVGAGVLIGSAFGWLPVGYLQFDPGGMTIGSRLWAFTVPWDRVARIEAGEFHDNPALYIWIDRPQDVLVHPPQRLSNVLRQLAWSERRLGAHVMVLTSTYDLDLPLLMRALERYVADPASRSELAEKKLLPAGNPQ
jgi:hypothetical protein